MRTVSTKTIIQPLARPLQRFEMRFADGERFILRAFDSRCAEHLAAATRIASSQSLEYISFRRELSDEEITPQVLAAQSRVLPELTADDLAEPLLTSSEAAAVLGIKEQSLRKRLIDGRLQGFKIGGRRMFSKERHLAPHLPAATAAPHLPAASDPEENKNQQFCIFETGEQAELTAENVGERLLSMKEAREFLNVSETTMLRRLRSGEMKSFQIGTKRLFSKEQHLIPFLRKCER